MSISTEVSERLESLVPHPDLAKAYIHRDIWGKQDFEVFDWARTTKRNLLIKGPTQAAKTMALRAYGSAKRIPVVTVDVGAAMDPALTLGVQRRVGNNWEWYDGVLTLVTRHGEGVAILDECNMAHPKVMACYHSLGDHRRYINLSETGEIVKAGPNLLLAATMNPDYIGTSPIGQAFSARFAHMEWGYSREVETKLLAPSIRKLAEKLRESEDIQTPVSTHMLMVFQDTIGEMGYAFATAMFKEGFSGEERTALNYAFDAGLDTQVQKEMGA